MINLSQKQGETYDGKLCGDLCWWNMSSDHAVEIPRIDANVFCGANRKCLSSLILSSDMELGRAPMAKH